MLERVKFKQRDANVNDNCFKVLSTMKIITRAVERLIFLIALIALLIILIVR